MKTILLVRPPSTSSKTYFHLRSQLLAKEVAKECQSFRYAPTLVYTGQDPDVAVQMMQVNNAIQPRYLNFEALLDYDYRATEIQHKVFTFLSMCLEKTEVLIVGAVPNIAMYCLDFIKSEMKGEVNQEFINEGEALLFIENLGSKRIIAPYVPHLKVIRSK